MWIHLKIFSFFFSISFTSAGTWVLTLWHDRDSTTAVFWSMKEKSAFHLNTNRGGQRSGSAQNRTASKLSCRKYVIPNHHYWVLNVYMKSNMYLLKSIIKHKEIFLGFVACVQYVPVSVQYVFSQNAVTYRYISRSTWQYYQHTLFIILAVW